MSLPVYSSPSGAETPRAGAPEAGGATKEVRRSGWRSREQEAPPIKKTKPAERGRSFRDATY